MYWYVQEFGIFMYLDALEFEKNADHPVNVLQSYFSSFPACSLGTTCNESDQIVEKS